MKTFLAVFVLLALAFLVVAGAVGLEIKAVLDFMGLV
jgi:hypothetical protein